MEPTRESRLEALARDLASGRVSRRSALGRLLGVTAALTVPSALLTETAHAKCPPKRRCGSKCCPKGARCRRGKCKCKSGLKKCGRKCVNLSFDPANCGACGRVCAAEQTCSNGHCAGGATTPTTPVCGDGTAEEGEQCDGADLRGATCASLGLGGGTLACGPGCTYDTSGCVQQPVCGNGLKETGESCDGTDLGDATCQSLGLGSGALACRSDCTYDTSGCVEQPQPTCGDGIRNGTEACDGTDLGGATCASLGFTAGTLACKSDCTYNTAGCTTCGNGIREGGEVCDGNDHGGATCQSLGYQSGTLSCTPNCQSLDTSNCVQGPGGCGSPTDCPPPSGCVNGTCGACTHTSQCAAPLECVNGECTLILPP